MTEGIQRLRIKFENERPVELLEFTAALAAVGDEYRSFRGDNNGCLRVERITEGSIDAVLTDVTSTAMIVAPVADQIVKAFSEHWVGLLKAVANYGLDKLSDAKAKSASKRSIKNAIVFARPANNGNAITVTGDNNTVITGPYINVDRSIAEAIITNGSHLLAPDIAEEARFTNEPLKLYQARDAKAGDLGYIDRFSPKPRRLIFADDAVKAEMLHGEARAFDVFFYVSGLVKTAGGEIAGYYIDKIDGFTERDAG